MTKKPKRLKKPEPDSLVDEKAGKSRKHLTPSEKATLFLKYEMFTTGQLAQFFGVAPRTISKWFDAGDFGPDAYRLPGSQDRRFPKTTLLTFVRDSKLHYHMQWMGDLTKPLVSLVGFTETQAELLRRDASSAFLQWVRHDNPLNFQYEIFIRPPLLVVVFGGSACNPADVIGSAKAVLPDYPMGFVFCGASTQQEAARLAEYGYSVITEDQGLPAVMEIINNKIAKLR